MLSTLFNTLKGLINSNTDITSTLSNSNPHDVMVALTEQDSAGNSLLHLAVDANHAANANSLMTNGEQVAGLLKTMLLLKNKSGNTPPNSGLINKKIAVTEAIINKALENGDLIIKTLTVPNNFYSTPLESIIAQDNITMFKQIVKQATIHGIEKQLFSLTNSEGKSVYQVASSLSAPKIKEYIISKLEGLSGQSKVELLTEAMEFGLAFKQVPVLDKVVTDKSIELGFATIAESYAELNAHDAQLTADQAKKELDAYDKNAARPLDARQADRPFTSGAELKVMSPRRAEKALAGQKKWDKEFWENADKNLKHAQNIHKLKKAELVQKEQEAKQAQQTADSFKYGLYVNKLPQVTEDLHWLANKVTGSDFTASYISEATVNNYVWPVYTAATGLTATYLTASPFIGLSNVLQHQWTQDAIAANLGDNAALINGAVAAGLFAISGLMGTMSLPMAGAILAIQGASYALNDVTEDSSLFIAKPILELAAGTISIAYSPLAILQAIEALHMVKSIADIYENAAQYAQVTANLMHNIQELTPANSDSQNFANNESANYKLTDTSILVGMDMYSIASAA
jgi:hypothetical protein